MDRFNEDKEFDSLISESQVFDQSMAMLIDESDGENLMNPVNLFNNSASNSASTGKPVYPRRPY